LANIAAVFIRKNETASTRLTPTLRTSDAETGRHPGLTSGRVAFDERGNAKWQMRISGHSFSDGSTTLVRKLVPPLSLEPTVRVPKLTPASLPGRSQPGLKAEVKPANPARAPTRAEMGTVRTFPVRSSTATLKAKTAVGAKPHARPAGLMGRLFGRKS
jgi:hypothetical protein